ncbi:MAG: hypothetical protein AAFN79_13270 [Pseudomonadota bacterium]
MLIMRSKDGKWDGKRRPAAKDAPSTSAAEEAARKWREMRDKRSELIESISDEKLKASTAKN